MGKIKEHYMQEQQERFEQDLSYGEWLRDNIDEPSEVELNLMEEDLRESSNLSSQIITYIPLNNPNYNPFKGSQDENNKI